MNGKQDNLADRAHWQELFGELCNGTLAEPRREQLAALLASNEEAMDHYLDYIMVHVRLSSVAMLDLRRGESPENWEESPEKAIYSLPAEVSPGREAQPLSSNPKRHSRRSRKRRLRWALALAALIGFVLAYVTGFDRGADNQYLVAQETTSQDADGKDADGVNTMVKNTTAKATSILQHPSNQTPSAEPASQPLYVAQISGVTPDVRWGSGSASREFLLRIRRGDRLELESGLVEIDYFSGAKIILHGPCVFVPTAPSAGRLMSGQLTGLVTVGDFTLTTPTAQVIDLGTEFGVSLDDTSGTDVCVFDGKVRVSSSTDSDSLKSQSQLLQKGMAVRVARGEGITRLIDSQPERFVRSLPASNQNTNEVSLVHLLSGLHRNRFRLAGVIAPDTGESDRQPWLREDGPGYSVSSGYQKTDWHPFVDGVFIPQADGKQTQIDSQGRRVDLPLSSGRTWGPIWSRSRIEGDARVEPLEDFWGAGSLEEVVDRLEHCKTGMIGVHSNVGVTFDLAAIRQQSFHNPSETQAPLEFLATVSNLNNAWKRVPEWAKLWRFSADFRVYVDGELRDSRLDFSREQGEILMSVGLTGEDQFLTIITTDAAEEGEPHAQDANDHVVIIDPVLKF
jgi:hypothetical protein